MTTGNTHRAVLHLQTAGAMYPKAWKQVEMFRRDRGKDLPNWPAWCFLPMAAWYAIVSEGGQLPLYLAPDIAKLAAIGTWRYTQGIYRFDDDIARELGNTLLTGDIPSEVLYRLPEWSVYIETPGRQWGGKALHGFWAHLEWDVETHRPELRLLIDCEAGLIPQILHLGPWTVTEAVDRWFQESKKQIQLIGKAAPDSIYNPDTIQAVSASINPLLSLVMYLCSDEPDIDDERQPGSRPAMPKPTRTKKYGFRLFPADKPIIWNVAGKLGDELRTALASASEVDRAGPRPHTRKAHWHGYWTGPRDGERKFVYKWLPVTVVAAPKPGSAEKA